MSRQQAPQSRESDRTTRRGVAPQESKSNASQKLTIRSVLIEPRHNEPPRVSVSVEYKGRAPGVQALQKAAMEVCHDVCRASGYVDLGYRHQQRSRELVQTFEVRARRVHELRRYSPRGPQEAHG